MASYSSTSDPEQVDWHNDKDLLPIVEKFHAMYAMPPDKLAKMKYDHEIVLNKFVEDIDFCIDKPIKGIGGSYEGVKVVKSEEDDDFEFDVMFVLKIPKGCELEIVEIDLPGRHGYAMLKVVNGSRDSPDYYRSINHKLFAGCLTVDENGMCIVDAGKATSVFFGELKRWMNKMNTKPIPEYDLLTRQHGTAIQMDVSKKQIGANKKRKLYSVDIVPTFEVGEDKKRYITKPVKKLTPDSITWRLLFDSEDSASVPIQLARNILRSAAAELRKQLSEHCASCEGICQGSCIVLEAARKCLPLPDEYLMKLREALIGRESRYRLTLVNLQELDNSKSKRLVAVTYFFENELDVMPVPDKAGYAWLKFGKVAVCSRFEKALKLCYLPGGKYLDIKAASDMLVKELKDIAIALFKDDEVIVRRDGPIVRIDVYPEKENKMLYYCLDIVLAVCVDGNFYVGLPHDYDDVPDKKAWRRSYSYEETEKIRQAPEGLKMVFRILKALRNGEPGLAQLTSYHFKTLLLNMQELEFVNWNESIDKILIRVLKYLKVCLSDKELRTYFILEINLLEPMLNDCSANMKNRIDELLRSKRKFLKALGDQKKETTDDILKQHRSESAQVCLESRFVQGFAYGHLKTQLTAEINERLLGYDYMAITSKPVYEDITAYIFCPNEVQGLTSIFHALLLISDNKRNLRACQYNPSVIRVKHCNSTVSKSLLQTVIHESGLADTRKTAEYIKQQMEKLINKSPLLRDNVSVHLERSVIVLKSNCDLQLNILTGYEVDEGFFINFPEAPGTNAWCPIPFTPIRNKFWKAFQISDCGRRALNELGVIRSREPRLAKLNESHLRMAVFWEMEVEQDWSDEKLQERLRDVLDRLLVSVKKKNLPNYFYPERNTL